MRIPILRFATIVICLVLCSPYQVQANGYSGYTLTSGTVTFIEAPGAYGTFPSGINAGGQIVGYYFDGTTNHGFLYSGGSFTPINVPGATGTDASGINTAGQIVGTVYFGHGFLYSGGSFTPINVPGATHTFASGINDAGQIVGYSTPEPSSLLLLGAALMGLAAWRWKRAA